ncbi:MAG TPA: TetR family transcriptional regulator [Solirubrobacterales bacterium]|nr:TetR family transcriptional regulator [Solirubrobacterales bacterium]
MVVTPWGSSETLREGMLPPGPGRTPTAVAENQKQRLFGAMVASVAERGYWNTRVADLVELSGVSLRSFYDLFPDKRACFLATVSSLAAATVEVVLGELGEGAWEEESRRRLATLAELVARQPAAAKLFLIEAYVAGPEAAAAVEETSRQVEAEVRRHLASSERWAGLPPEIGTVAVAAILEAFRARLLKEQAQRLPEVADEIASLFLSFRPPQRPLRSAARPPEIRPEEREASDHAERALRAFEALLAEGPYEETTMEQVAKRAKMSVRTLYANFSSREDLMLAAIDSAGALTVATVLPAHRRSPNPTEGIRAAFAALLGLFASRPNLAHLLLVGAFEGGGPAIQRRSEALRPIEGLLSQPALHRHAGPRGITAEAILSGVLGLARRRLLDAGPGGLPSLIPVCTYVALSPLVGPEQATAAAEEKSYKRGRTRLADMRQLGLADPIKAKLITFLSHGPVSVGKLVEALPQPREQIEAQIAELEDAGVIEMVGEDAEGDDRVFVTGWPVLSTEEWQGRKQDAREQLSEEIGRAIKEEVEEAFAAGTFDARIDRFLVRLPMWLDEEGWRELAATLDRTLEACLAIQERTKRRLVEDAEVPGTSARVILASFETPLSDRGQESAAEGPSPTMGG